MAATARAGVGPSHQEGCSGCPHPQSCCQAQLTGVRGNPGRQFFAPDMAISSEWPRCVLRGRNGWQRCDYLCAVLVECEFNQELNFVLGHYKVPGPLTEHPQHCLLAVAREGPSGLVPRVESQGLASRNLWAQVATDACSGEHSMPSPRRQYLPVGAGHGRGKEKLQTQCFHLWVFSLPKCTLFALERSLALPRTCLSRA